MFEVNASIYIWKRKALFKSKTIINNNTGWCANTEDNEELTSILIEAITNSKLRHFYGKNALKRFESELNADIVTNQLIDFIKI